MKFKQLTKLTSKTNPGIYINDKKIVATDGFALAEVPFDQTTSTDPREKLEGTYKKAYFTEEIDTVHDGEILYKNELLLRPAGQGDMKFVEYDKLLKLDERTVSLKLDLKVLQKLINVFKEQRDTDVHIHITSTDKPLIISGEKVTGMMMGMTEKKK